MPTSMEKPLNGAGLAIVNQIFNERLSELGGGSGGVNSFNGRSGAVVPGNDDYTAEMVGARPDTWMPTAEDVGAATMGEVIDAIKTAVGSIEEVLSEV